ncbi:lmo0937 family membrane protein [Marinilactibacillus piezotolerans]
MIWTLIGILLLFWVIGLVLDVVGGLIHILLVIALIAFIYNMISGRKKRR